MEPARPHPCISYCTCSGCVILWILLESYNHHSPFTETMDAWITHQCMYGQPNVGELQSRDISPRVRVWSEPGVVDAAAYEFAETEEFLSAAESLTCPYQWGRYDVLCLPPSFPYGGMENPCLTFATPTLLAGDRSLADVIAHEIAHSWTGNLVTNHTWEHFWLNEGWTVWVSCVPLCSVRRRCY